MRTYDSVTLFFPASGKRNNNNGTLSYVGEYGNGDYWTANAYISPNSLVNGSILHFYSRESLWSYQSRSWGYPVRAVAEE